MRVQPHLQRGRLVTIGRCIRGWHHWLSYLGSHPCWYSSGRCPPRLQHQCFGAVDTILPSLFWTCVSPSVIYESLCCVSFKLVRTRCDIHSSVCLRAYIRLPTISPLMMLMHRIKLSYWAELLALQMLHRDGCENRNQLNECIILGACL